MASSNTGFSSQTLCLADSGARQGRSFICLLPVLLIWGLALLLLAAAGPAGAQQSSKAPSAPGSAFDAKKHFTIVKVEPDAMKEEVRVFFSQPLDLDSVRSNLRLLPRVKVDWPRTTMSPQGVLTLRGAFRYATGYLINVPETLHVGNKTYHQTVHTFFMPDRPPKVDFVGAKNVIERDSRQLLHVRAQNVNNLRFEGIRVPPLLLPLALAVEKSPTDWTVISGELKAAAAGLKPLLAAHKDLAPFVTPPLDEKQLFPAAGEKNQPWAISLPLSWRQGKEAGALELIRVANNEAGSGAASAPRVFEITDLGLTYKRSQQNLLLWVTSLKTGTPMAGARVIGFTKDMEVFPLGQTNADGVLICERRELSGLSLKNPKRPTAVKRAVDQADLVLLVAGTKDDVAFIEVLPQGNLKPQGIWQAKIGEKLRTLRGNIFTERGVYRPGEKVFFKGAVREYDQGRIFPPTGEVCSFELISPKGEQIFTGEDRTSDFGTVAGEIPTQSYWPLGTYTLNMTYGPEIKSDTAEKPQGRRRQAEAEEDKTPRNQVSVTFQLQEFKPPRHFVGINFQQISRDLQGYVNRGEQRAPFVKIALTGSYYAGGPVKHGQVRWKIYQAKTSYQVPGHDDFTFGYGGDEQGELIESGQSILDEQGRAELEFPLDRQVMNGQHGLSVVATVVDFDGRAATDTKAFQVTPEKLVGISRHTDSARADEEQVLKVMVAKPDGKPISKGVVKAEILQKSWVYVPKRNEQGDLYWDGQDVWTKTVGSDLTLDKGTAAFHFSFAWGGSYLVSFTYTDETGKCFTSATAYEVAGESYAYEHREEPYQPLALAADKPAYKPGEKAVLTARPQRPVSRYLLTLEQDGVLKYQVTTPKPGEDRLEVPIGAEYAPNVFVSVLGLTPRGEFPVYTGHYDIEAPNFYWGTLNLPVRQEVEALKIQISPGVQELKAEPGANVTLDFTVLDSKGNGVQAEMAVAVVDEAVLALTGFKTPTLESLAKFDRPLGVFTGELRSFLVHQTPFYLSKNEPLTGGGGMNEEMMSKLRRRFEAVAYFNPRVLTDAQGKTQVSFTLPDNLTTYRIYTVVLDKGSRYGSAERPLLATKEFYLEPGLPNFFTKGDTFKFQVAAFNNSTAQGPVQFSAVGDGGLFLSAAEPEPVAQLNPKDSLKLNVSGKAASPGPAAAHFEGGFQGKSDAVELKLRINSGHVRDTEVWFGSLAGTSEIKVALPSYLTGKVDPEEVQAVLTVAGSPFLRMTEAIHYLLQYPYGCVEQTSSGVMALAALRGAIEKGLVSGVSLAETDKYLDRGLGRILGMQTDSGGFAYWPGQRDAHVWGSIYATTALSLAKAGGLDVPDDSLNSALDYLKKQVEEPKRALAIKAFACYVLALNGALDPDTYKTVHAHYAKLHRESKLLLLLAATLADLRPAKELQTALQPLVGSKVPVAPAEKDDEFRAQFRTPALALLAGATIMPQDPATKEEALLLLMGLDHQGIWTSTSDTGWALLALGEYFKGVTFGTEPVEISVSQPGAPQTERFKLDPKGFRTVGLDAGALLKNPVVKIEGQAGKTWLYKLEVTGPRLDIAKTGASHGFKVRREIKNTDGGDVIKVGDLVKVTVFLDVAGKEQRYVMLDDPLPAGLMAINSAFTTEEQVPQGDEDNGDDFDYVTREGTIRFRPNYFEIKNDRVLAYRDAVYSGSYRFEYYCRAICEGTFVAPATRAAAMYSPGVNGYSAQGELVVKGR
ncbi:MAG: alpha-2-macroglobulin family protein [Desulfobaccales bacterium]